MKTFHGRLPVPWRTTGRGKTSLLPNKHVPERHRLNSCLVLSAYHRHYRPRRRHSLIFNACHADTSFNPKDSRSLLHLDYFLLPKSLILSSKRHFSVPKEESPILIHFILKSVSKPISFILSKCKVETIIPIRLNPNLEHGA